jgi:hypothetical protein
MTSSGRLPTLHTLSRVSCPSVPHPAAGPVRAGPALRRVRQNATLTQIETGHTYFVRAGVGMSSERPVAGSQP